MPGKCIAAPRTRRVEEDASDILPDWWRQIDRWMNEGGADERPAVSQGKPGRQRERDSA
jgi:hypothetical protein